MEMRFRLRFEGTDLLAKLSPASGSHAFVGQCTLSSVFSSGSLVLMLSQHHIHVVGTQKLRHGAAASHAGHRVRGGFSTVPKAPPYHG